MELKQLCSFAAVVRYGSFTKASEKLYLSQPTISSHIQKMEEELGKRLILRTTKSLEVTPMGQAVYRRVVDILALQQQIIEVCTHNGQKVIRLGASTIPSAYVLPQLLPEFGQLYPDVCFTVQQTNSQGVADGLVDGLYDVGLMGMKGNDQLTCIPFCKDRIVLIAPAAEPYLSMDVQTPAQLGELLKQPMILREGSSGSQRTADRFLESMGISEEQFHVVARINDQEAIKNMVAGGLGISFISERAAQNFVEEKRIMKFDLPEHNVRDLYLAHRREYILPAHVKDFLSFVQKKYRNELRLAESRSRPSAAC